MKSQITICGGGNAAHTLAGLLGSWQDLSVQVYAPLGNEAQLWQEGIEQNNGITVDTPAGKVQGRPTAVYRDPGAAVEGSQLILMALPAFAHEPILKQIAAHVSPGAWVGALPARGGFDLCVRDVFKDRLSDISIFGFQTLPWACRIQEFGKRVTILGAKAQVDLTAWPSEMAPIISARLQKLLNISINPIASFLSLALADTGQLIHPGIMYGLFHNWNGEPYHTPPLFYQGVDADIAGILQLMSNEIQSLRATLEAIYPCLDLSAVRPLADWLQRSYQANIGDSRTLQSSFATNSGYAGLLAPVQNTANGFIPNFQARYLSEDVPYNLLATRGIAELARVSTPVIDKVLSWAQIRLEKEYLVSGKLQGSDLSNTRSPQRYGFTGLDQLIQEMQYLPSKKVNA
jgi:NAD/NADP octopine/nopaline dehydrogenase, alpha-helical domain